MSTWRIAIPSSLRLEFSSGVISVGFAWPALSLFSSQKQTSTRWPAGPLNHETGKVLPREVTAFDALSAQHL